MKKFLVLPHFFFIPLILMFLFRCSENPSSSLGDQRIDTFYKGPGGGGGGHTTTQINNLSFPALCADGYSITPIANPLFSVVYEGPFTGITTDQSDYLQLNGPWYAQKVEGNIWQAEFHQIGPVDVTFVDWGDAIESIDPKIGRPYRLELALYNQLTVPMMGYIMEELAFPSSPQETQGTNKITYLGEYAAIGSPKGRLVIQKFEDATLLTWNGSSWDNADAPINITFAQELNVGGKLIYGASQGGWTPTEMGNYRITFYMATGSTVNLSFANIGDYGNPPVVPKIGENNSAVVDVINNLTYIDVQTTTGGGH